MTLIAMLARAYRRWRAYRETLTELSVLDDRALADLNLRRSEIDFVAREVAQKVA